MPFLDGSAGWIATEAWVGGKGKGTGIITCEWIGFLYTNNVLAGTAVARGLWLCTRKMAWMGKT